MPSSIAAILPVKAQDDFFSSLLIQLDSNNIAAEQEANAILVKETPSTNDTQFGSSSSINKAVAPDNEDPLFSSPNLVAVALGASVAAIGFGLLVCYNKRKL